MHKLILLFLFTGVVFGQTLPNTLSPEEEACGYDLLWNGVDFTGWHEYRTDLVTEKWTVRHDGPMGTRIHTVAIGNKPLLTDKTYRNFDVKFDFFIPELGNSGFFVRYQEEATVFHQFRSGPEYQLCKVEDCSNPKTSLGAVYAMFPVEEAVRNTWENDDGWNQGRIIAYDSNYVHYGNGVKLLEYKIGTPEFIAAYERSKYASDGNNGNYYDIHFGSLKMQHKGREGNSFRNLKAKELTQHPFEKEFPNGWPSELPHEYSMEKPGCTNPDAQNYDATAILDDGNCNMPNSIEKEWMASNGMELKVDGNHVQILANGEDVHVSAATVAGRKIEAKKISSNQYKIDVRNISAGLVVVNMTANGSSFSKLLTISK